MPYLYFMPVFILCSLEEGTLWTESWPRLRATIATALNLLRVPVLGLLAFWRFSRSSVLRLTPPRWSVHTNDTCILAAGWQSQLVLLWWDSLLKKSDGGKLPEVWGSCQQPKIVQTEGCYAAVLLKTPPLLKEKTDHLTRLSKTKRMTG